MRYWVALPVLSCLLLSDRAPASSMIPMSGESLLDRAIGLCRGRVTALGCYRDDGGGIWTRATVRVDKSMKGRFPKDITLHYRGGRLPDEGEVCGLSPDLGIGEERLFLVWREADRRLTTVAGAGGERRLRRRRPSQHRRISWRLRPHRSDQPLCHHGIFAFQHHLANTTL